MGYPDQVRSNSYITIPGWAIIVALALSGILPILLMLQGR